MIVDTRVSNSVVGNADNTSGKYSHIRCGDKKIYACQSLRFKAIEKYKNEKNILARRYKASILNATKTSRQTFLDREMPYLVA